MQILQIIFSYRSETKSRVSPGLYSANSAEFCRICRICRFCRLPAPPPQFCRICRICRFCRLPGISPSRLLKMGAYPGFRLHRLYRQKVFIADRLLLSLVLSCFRRDFDRPLLFPRRIQRRCGLYIQKLDRQRRAPDRSKADIFLCTCWSPPS